MQIIPASWRVVGLDMDGDGVRDPQNIYDAAGAAMVYLCAGGRDLSTADGPEAKAILSYNDSDAYLQAVLGWKSVFDQADLTGIGAVPFTAALIDAARHRTALRHRPMPRRSPTSATAARMRAQPVRGPPPTPSARPTGSAPPSGPRPRRRRTVVDGHHPGASVPDPAPTRHRRTRARRSALLPNPPPPDPTPADPTPSGPDSGRPDSDRPDPAARVPGPDGRDHGSCAEPPADAPVVSPETCTPPEGYVFDPETGELVPVPVASPDSLSPARVSRTASASSRTRSGGSDTP